MSVLRDSGSRKKRKEVKEMDYVLKTTELGWTAVKKGQNKHQERWRNRKPSKRTFLTLPSCHEVVHYLSFISSLLYFCDFEKMFDLPTPEILSPPSEMIQHTSVLYPLWHVKHVLLSNYAFHHRPLCFFFDHSHCISFYWGSISTFESKVSILTDSP